MTSMRAAEASKSASTAALRGAAALALLLLQPGAADAAGVTVTPARLTVTAQRGATATISVEARDASGAPLTGVPFLGETSFGSLAPVVESAPGRYATTLELPAADMPRAAIVVMAPQGRPEAPVAWAVVPLEVRTTLSARTEPRTRVSARVAGRTFGPVEALRDGTFSLDIELPPGADRAEVLLEDQAGNATTTTLDVPQRAHDPLTVALDRYRLTTDGQSTARVFAFAFDREGRPVRDARLEAVASAGEVGAFAETEPGVHVATYVPPADGRVGLASIEVTLRGRTGEARESDQLSLVRGLPAQMRLVATPTEVVSGKGTVVQIVADVRDAAGKPLPGQPVRMVADRGALGPVTDRADGTYAATLVPPDAVESGTIEVKAVLATGGPTQAPARLELVADPTAVPTSWSAFSLLTARTIDAEGQPVAGDVVLFTIVGGSGTVTPLAVTSASGQAFADFSADPTEESVTIEATSTTTPSLKTQVRIDKKSNGTFTIVTRPASVARGGRAAALLVLGETARVLEDAVVITLAPGEPATLAVTADPDRLPADGRATSSLVARLRDAAGNDVADATLGWTADRGSVAASPGAPEGAHGATYVAPEGAGSGRATVTAAHAASGLSAAAPLTLEVGPPARLALAVTPARMPADGMSRASVEVRVQDVTGVAVPQARVSLEVSGVEAVVDDELTTDGGGIARGELVAGYEAGRATLTARLEETGATATATVDLFPLGPVRLTVEASPARIAAGGSERSEIVVELEDALGAAMEGEIVDLRLAGPSAARLTSTAPRSDANGQARAYVSGPRPERVTIEARSRTVPSLRGEATVEIAGTLAVAFSATAPACAPDVQLAASVPGATEWAWDWTGDGRTDSTLASPVAPLPPGTHRVTLRARDASGGEGVAAQDVVVLAPPQALATATPAQAPTGGAVRLDASASTSAAPPLAFAWDLDGDASTIESTAAALDWTAADGRRTATVTVTDAQGCASVATASATFGELPDLALDLRLVGPAERAPGEELDVEVAWSNVGASTSAAAMVEITPDAALTLVRTPSNGVPVGRAVRFLLGPIPSSGAGSSGSFTMTFRAPAQVTGMVQLAVTGRIGSTGLDANAANDADAVSIAIREAVDLSVTARPLVSSPLHAGEELRVELEVTNLAGTSASGVMLQIGWSPSGSAVLVDPHVDGDPPVTGNLVTVSLGTLGPGASERRVLIATLPAVLRSPAESIAFQAETWHAGVDQAPGDNRDSTTVDWEGHPDLRLLALTASIDDTHVEAGGEIRYVARFDNAGTTTAQGVTLVARTQPAFVEELVRRTHGGLLTRGAGSDTITFSQIPPLDPGDPAIDVEWTVEVAQALPPGTTSLALDAELTCQPPGTDPTPETDSVTVPYRLPSAALVVGLSAPAGAASGGSATHVVTVRNDGGPATGVVLELELAGAVLASASSSLPGPAPAPGDPLVLRTDPLAIPAGATVTWTHVSDVACPQPVVDPVVVARARALAGGAPATPDTLATTAIAARPQLALALDMPAAAAPGSRVAGAVTVTAGGCAPARAVVADVTWPAGVAATAGSDRIVFGDLLAGVPTTRATAVDVAAVQDAASNVLAVDAAATCTGCPVALAQDAVSVAAAPEVTITAEAIPSTVAAGAPTTLRTTLVNAGSTAARNVQISLATASPARLGPLPAPRLILSVPADGVARTHDFPLVAAASQPSGAGDVVITANASVPGDPTANRGDATLTIVSAPDLEVALSHDALAGTAEGDVVSFTAVVTNRGTTPSIAPRLRLVRDPAVLRETDASQSAGTFDVVLEDLDPLESTTKTFRFQVADPLPTGTSSATVTATSIEPADVQAANDTGSATVFIGLVADVAVEIAPLRRPATLRAGDVVGVDVQVTNLGSGDAPSVRLEIGPVPFGAVANAAGTVPAPAGFVAWDLGTVAAGTGPGAVTRSFSFTVPARLPAPRNPFTLTATVTPAPGTPQNDTSNDTATTPPAEAIASADVCVDLTITPSQRPVATGTTLAHDVVLTNAGSTGATVDVVLDVDARLGADETWTAVRVEPGDTVPLTTARTVPAATAATETYVATATATAPEDDGASGTCVPTDADSETRTTLADLEVTHRQRLDDDPAGRGTRVTYDIEVRNAGTVATTDGTLRFAPHAELVFESATGGGAPSGGEIAWPPLGPMQPTDPPRTFTVVMSVAPALAQGAWTIDATSRVQPADPDADASNDAFTTSFDVLLDVDLLATVRLEPVSAPATCGDAVDAVVTVTNRGALDATGVRVAVDWGAFAAPAGAPGPVTVGSGTVASGATSPEVRVRGVLAPLVDDPSVTTTVTATPSSVEIDAVPSNDVASADLTWSCEADLHVELSASRPSLRAGETTDLVAIVTNRGRLTARSTTVTVTHDALLAPQAPTTVAAGDLRLGDPPFVVTVPLEVASPLPALVNDLRACATAAALVTDRFLADNAACATVQALAAPDLHVTVQLTPPRPTLAPGDVVPVVVTVLNEGSSAATSVEARFDYREDLVRVASAVALSGVPGAGASDDGTALTLAAARLNVGESLVASFDLAVHPALPRAADTLDGTACASAAEPDDDPADDCAPIGPVPIVAVVDAWIALATTPAACAAGDVLTLRVDHGNRGQAPAAGATITITLPPELTVVDPGGFRWAGGVLTRGPFDIVPGSATDLVQVRVAATLPAASNALPVAGRIDATTSPVDANPADDAAALMLACTACADLVTSIRSVPATPGPGQAVTYQVTVLNSGSTTASGVQVTVEDSPLATPTGQPANATLPLVPPALAPGQSGTAQFSYVLPGVMPGPSSALVTCAKAASAVPECDTSDDRACATSTVSARPDLWTTVDVSPDTGAACTSMAVSILYGNDGECPAGATVVLTVPASVVTRVDAPTADGPAVLDGGLWLVTWTLSDVPVQPGPQGPLAATLEVACVQGAPTNALFVTSDIQPAAGATDRDLFDNVGIDRSTVTASPDLVVTLTFEGATLAGSPVPPQASATLAYRVKVKNVGTTRATDVQGALTVVPNGLFGWQPPITWAAAEIPADGVDVDFGTFTLDALPRLPATSNPFTVRASTTAAEADAAPVTNTATIIDTLLAWPDLQLSLGMTDMTAPPPMEDGDVVRYQYTYANVGSAPAEKVIITGEVDTQVLSWSSGGTWDQATGTVTLSSLLPSIPPNGLTYTTSALFTVNPLPPPPVQRIFSHSAVVSEEDHGLARDRDPIDNVAAMDAPACFLTASVFLSGSNPICMGGSVTLVARTEPTGGIDLAWSEAGGQGAFDSQSARSVIFTPPVTPTDATYVVRLTVTDRSTGCRTIVDTPVATTASCTACGCRATPVRIRYDGALSRADRAGDRTVEQGETVSFVVRVRELNQARSAILLASGSRLSFGNGATVYTAGLVGDTYVECGSTMMLEFASTDVPPDMPLGTHPVQLEFTWIDDCGDTRNSNDNTGGDRVTVQAPMIRGVDGGITFTEWGPER